MIDRETLAAQIFSRIAAEVIFDPDFDPTDEDCDKEFISLLDIEECFKAADAFLAYAAKQREPKACEHWGSSATEPCDYCKSCGAPKVKPEPPKPEHFAVGTRVIVFDRYRLALPCFGEVVKTEGVNNGCLVMLERGSHGRADERYSEGIYVHFEQLRKAHPDTPKPERVARLLLIHSWGNETYQVLPWDGVGTIPTGFSVFREILPGDGK